MTSLELNLKAKRHSSQENEVMTQYNDYMNMVLNQKMTAFKADIKALEIKMATPANWHNWVIYDDFKP